MEIYQKMYLKLFNAVTDAIKVLPENSGAAKLLILATQECEELYMSADEERIATSRCSSQ